VADEGAGCGTANGAHRAAKEGVAGYAADHGADTGAQLGVGGVGCTTTQSQGRSAGGRKKDVTDVHGEIPWWLWSQAVVLNPRRQLKLDLYLHYRRGARRPV
jgi:hypothetical protein